MRAVFVATVTVLASVLLPGDVLAQGSVEDAIRTTIEEWYAFGRENLQDMPGTYSGEGSVEFWSSGGLIQDVPADLPPQDYVFELRTPKHIRVTTLGTNAAVVHMYVEGGFQVEGEDPVPNYFTRGMLVVVLEDGEWVTRAAHWSPVRGGAGTNQTAPVTN